MANAMVGALFATLGLDTAVFQKGLDDADGKAKGFAAGVGPVGDMLKSGLAVGFTAAGAAAVAAGAFFLKSGLDALQSADDIGDAAVRLGVTSEAFQKLEIAATSAGAAPGLMTEAMDKLNVGLGAFIQSGGGPAADAFDALGLSSRIASGEIATADQAFYAAAQALEGITSPAEKARLSMQLFGRGAGADMLEVLAPGEAALRGYGEAAAESGRIMSNEMVDKLANAKLTIDNTKLAFGQMAQVIAGEVIVSSMAFLENLSPMIEQGKALAGQIGEFLGPSFRELATSVSSLMSGPFGQLLIGTLRLIAEVVGTVVVVALKAIIETLNLWVETGDRAWRSAAAFVENVKTGFQFLSTEVPVFIQRMVEGVTSWLQGRLFEVLRGVINRVQQVSDAFFRLYDAVVGNSYIPDMVVEIADWMGPRLREAMVNPALSATAETGSAFSSMAGEIDTQITDIFKSITSKDWSGALGGIFSILGGQAGNMGKIGKLGTAVMGAFGGKIPGFKGGGSFTVGGSGAPDSKIMSMRLSPGEMVDIRRPGQDMGRGAPVHFDMRGAVMTSDLLRQMEGMAMSSGGAAVGAARSIVPGDLAKRSAYRTR